MAVNDLYKIWEDLYDDPPSAQVFAQTVLIMNDIKETLDNPLVKEYSPDWNDTIVTIDELQLLCPEVFYHYGSDYTNNWKNNNINYCIEIINLHSVRIGPYPCEYML